MLLFIYYSWYVFIQTLSARLFGHQRVRNFPNNKEALHSKPPKPPRVAMQLTTNTAREDPYPNRCTAAAVPLSAIHSTRKRARGSRGHTADPRHQNGHTARRQPQHTPSCTLASPRPGQHASRSLRLAMHDRTTPSPAGTPTTAAVGGAAEATKLKGPRDGLRNCVIMGHPCDAFVFQK